eukprot:Em0001g3475a
MGYRTLKRRYPACDVDRSGGSRRTNADLYWGKCEGKKTALISPHTFSGNSSWSDWVDHFEAVAKVNQWDEDTKLIWLPVKLKRKAQTAWKRLSEETREDCRYLSEIEDPKIEFAVRQQRPETLEETDASTLEMESYAAVPDKGMEAEVSSTAEEDLDTEGAGKLNALRTADQVQEGVKEVQNLLMVDTGAAVSLLRREQWSRLSGAEKHKMEQWDGGRLVGVACRSGRFSLSLVLKKYDCAIGIPRRVMQIRDVTTVMLYIQCCDIKSGHRD